MTAFANSPSIYTNQIPESVSGEMEIPEGMDIRENALNLAQAVCLK